VLGFGLPQFLELVDRGIITPILNDYPLYVDTKRVMQNPGYR